MNKKVEIINSENIAFKLDNKPFYFSENQILKTKKETSIYVAHNQDDKYIFKINHTKKENEFNLITHTIKHLNKSRYKTAKLIYSKYENNTSYFIFEYIEGKKIKKESQYLKPIANLMTQFYILTKEIPIKPELTLHELIKDANPKTSSPYIKNIFKENINLIKNNNHSQLIICDINTSNFIETENGLYIIDFDEIFFAEIEFDIADFFTDYFEVTKQPINKIILEYKQYLSLFSEYKLNIDKIISYIILILISEITPNAPKEENSQKLETLKFILINKNILKKHLQV